MNTKVKSGIASIILLGVLYICVKFIFSNVLNSKMYPNFGIRIPNGYTMHGIDVSRYQKDINWKLLSEMRDQGVKINFAFLKCTEGISIADGTYSDNLKGANKYSISCGAYHYFRPNISGEAQAKYFINHANLKPGNFAPVIDIEETRGTSNLTLQKELKTCLDILEKKYNCKPIIYCNVDFYDAHIGANFNEYPLWAAHYYVKRPDIKRSWNIWQHSDKGNVNGIDAKVDFNVLNGNVLDLERLKIP